jgi:hypothetical protein
MEWAIWLPSFSSNGLSQPVICLTFDTDWMQDAELARFLSEFDIPGRATFFLHDTLPSVYGSRHELCPHPFFDDLENWEVTLSSRSRNLPNSPKGVRPHSCVFSHLIGVGLCKLGYQYVSQETNLFACGMAPHRHPWGIWEVPIYYMDNMDFCMRRNWPDINHEPFSRQIISNAISERGLYVFDFHPLHIALNTRTYEDYEAVKLKIINERASPFSLTAPGRGVRTFFTELCSAMKSSGMVSYSCWDALRELGCCK